MLLDYLNYIAIRLLEHGIVLCLIIILQIADRLEDEVLNMVCGIPITGHPMPRVVAEQLLKLLATESPLEPKNVQKNLIYSSLSKTDSNKDGHSC
jgi:hypothetical protein